MKEKKYFRFNELQKEICEIHEKGISKGEYIGFASLENLYSIKLGSTTYVMGSPYSGKTEWWLDVMINLTEFHGWNHVVFSSETGKAAEIAYELIRKWNRKSIYNNKKMSEKELHDSMTRLNEHFFIVDPKDTDMTIPEFFSYVDDIEKDHGVKIHTTLADPFNELKHEWDDRQDLYIERTLGLIRRNAAKYNRHNCLITHSSEQSPIVKNGITYYPIPSARQYSGGQAWFRKGLGMMAIWRPPFGLSGDDGIPFEENETHIVIQKAKPKGIGKNGTVKFFLDWKETGRYYQNIDGEKVFASKNPPKPQAIQKSFAELEPDKAPF